MLTPAQHAERATGVGGSEAAIILGRSKRKTALQLYLEKRGELPIQTEPDDAESAWWGNALEPIVRQRYAEMTNRTIVLPSTIRSGVYPWMVAHVDGLVVGERRGYEGKTAFHSMGWGEEGTDSVPEEYLLQCHHYLTVLDYDHWDTCVLIGRKFQIYTIERDLEMSEMLAEHSSRFMTRVQQGNPPEMDFGHKTAVELAKKLAPGTNGVRLTASDEAIGWRARLKAATEAIKAADAEADECKAHLLQEMGEAHLLAFPDGKAYRRQLTQRAGYTVQPSEYLDCRFVNDPVALKKRK